MATAAIQNYPFTNTLPDRVMDVIPYALISAVAWTALHGIAVAVAFPNLFAACYLGSTAGFMITLIFVGVFRGRLLFEIVETENARMTMLQMVESPLKFCQGIVEFSPPLLNFVGVGFLSIHGIPFLLSPSVFPILTISYAALGVLAGGVKYLDGLHNDSTDHQERSWTSRKLTLINSVTGPFFTITTIALATLTASAFFAELPILVPASLFLISGTVFSALQGLEDVLDEKGWIGKYCKTSFVLNSLFSWYALVGGLALLSQTIPFLTPTTLPASLAILGSLFLVAKVASNVLKSRSDEFEWLYRRAQWGSNEARVEIFKKYGKAIVISYSSASDIQKEILEQPYKWLQESATQGNSLAQYQLGKYLLEGKHGFRRNVSEGLKLLQTPSKGVEQNKEKVFYRLGKYCFETQQNKLGADYLIKAIENGSKKALFLLGTKCFDDEKDSDTFLKMFKVLIEAAEKKSEIALYYLGKYYLHRSETQSVGLSCLQQSEEMGLKEAIETLIVYYASTAQEELVHQLLERHQEINLEKCLYKSAKPHIETPGSEEYGLKILYCMAFRKSYFSNYSLRARLVLYDYWFAQVTEEGDKKAVELLLKGVEVGCVYSKYRLGKYYVFYERAAEGIALWEEAISQETNRDIQNVYIIGRVKLELGRYNLTHGCEGEGIRLLHEVAQGKYHHNDMQEADSLLKDKLAISIEDEGGCC